MELKAFVTIIQERLTERNTIIVADVKIRGKTKRQTFSVDKNLSNDDKIKVISEKIRGDQKYVNVLKNFEVDL